MILEMLLLGAVSEEPCGLDRSMRTTVAELRERPNEYVGKCVTVTGLTDWLALFDTELMRRRVSDALRRGRSVANFAGQVGVYFPEETEVSRADPPPGRWSVTGRVTSCEQMHQESERQLASEPHEEGIIKLTIPTGFCHSRNGPVIIATAAVPLEP